MSDENVAALSNTQILTMFDGVSEAERASATAHLHAMKAQIGGLLEKQTKSRLIKEGLMTEEGSGEAVNNGGEVTNRVSEQSPNATDAVATL